jgi:hypothetical protein
MADERRGAARVAGVVALLTLLAGGVGWLVVDGVRASAERAPRHDVTRDARFREQGVRVTTDGFRLEQVIEVEVGDPSARAVRYCCIIYFRHPEAPGPSGWGTARGQRCNLSPALWAHLDERSRSADPSVRAHLAVAFLDGDLQPATADGIAWEVADFRLVAELEEGR